MGLDWSTPTHGPIKTIQGIPRSGESRAVSAKAGISTPGESVQVRYMIIFCRKKSL